MTNGLGLHQFSFPLRVLQQNGRRISRYHYPGENLAFALAFGRLQIMATASAMAFALFSCFAIISVCILSRPKTVNAHTGAKSKLYIIGTGGRVSHAGLSRYNRPETGIQLMFFCILALSRFTEVVHSSDHDLMLDVLHPRNSRELQATERCHLLNLHDDHVSKKFRLSSR
jgi:hypothetical protein